MIFQTQPAVPLCGVHCSLTVTAYLRTLSLVEDNIEPNMKMPSKTAIDCSTPGVFHCSDGSSRSSSDSNNGTNVISQEDVLCIPQAWVCDLDLDCPGGEDEHMDCPVPKCGKDQFECLPDSLVRCIPSHWECDGRRDCSQGEDEAPSKCEYDGSLVDTFRCHPNQFRCPRTRKCIHLRQICDGTVDCPLDFADEGPHCRNRACRTKNCPENRCRETIQGAVCYCAEGMEFNDTHCIDMDECKLGTFCDQSCVNTVGGYNCSCVDGYVNSGGGKCTVSADETAFLVVANYVNLETFDLTSARHRTITRSNIRRQPQIPHHQLPGTKVTMLDVNVHNKTICYLDGEDSQPDAKLMFSLRCVSLGKPSETWEIPIPYSLNAHSSDKKTTQQTDIKSFSRDWLSGNWYFSDMSREFIFMCAPQGHYCQPVITQAIKKPHSIALDPTRGYLFYSNWSPQAHIGRSSLDGSGLKQLAQVKVIHPTALTLDLPRKHVYWADSFLDVVERMSYDGGSREVVVKGPEVAFAVGLAVIENWLFVANHYNNSIVQFNTVHGSIPPQLADFKTLRPGGIKVYHSAMQPKDGDLNVCEKRSPPCEHLCFPMIKSGGGDAADGKLVAVCRCQLGYTMRDGKCQKLYAATETNVETLLLTNGQQGMIHILDPVRATDLFPPIANLGRPSATDCDAKGGVVYFYDAVTKTLARRGIQGGQENKMEVLRTDLKCEGLAFDWVGRNLYCSNSLPGQGKIVAVSLVNPQHQVTLLDSQSTNYSVSPKALALDASRGMLYWADWSYSGNSSINWLAADGSGWGTLLSDDLLRWPNGLALLPAVNSSEGSGTLYWTDAFYDTIESMTVDGQGRKELKKFQSRQHPYGLTVIRNKDNKADSDEGLRVLWAESIDGHLNQLRLPSEEVLTLRATSAPIFDVKFCSVKRQPPIENHPCSINNGGCSDLCLVTSDQGHVCKCADGRETTDGGITCTGDMSHPSCHEESEYECSNGKCIDKSRLCDGFPDCDDSSDEVSDSLPNICKNHTCADKGMFGCHSGLCIYSQFVCDGEADCEDKEDEFNCHPKHCKDGHRQCPDTGQCIPASWFCDGQRDCKHGEDENSQHCCPNGKCNTGSCGIDQFMCKLDGRCISYEYRCDNEYDCSDNSDEMDCKVYCDPELEFTCHHTDMCIPRAYVCDGLPNCLDGSDENECKNIQCSRDEMACPEGKCLKLQFQCDGVQHCFDGSDEQNCYMNTTRAPKTCHWSQFRCEDGSQCIPAMWQCDEDYDCRDKSDEKHCAKKCAYPNFACKNLPSLCLPPEKLCNDFSDCPDHSDEGRLCEYNMCLNNNCEKICHSAPWGYVCSCPSNQRIKPDNKTCIDIDTCETWGICSQGCSPTADGHKCYCNEGYVLRPDGYSCRPTDLEPHYLILANRHDISRFDLTTKNHTSLQLGLKNTISVDFHFNKSLLFWSDLIEDKIYRGHITGAGLSSVEPIIENGMIVTEGLAVDWITEHIYWVESSLDHIEVAKFDGSQRGTLIAGNIARPRAITLDPSVGALFWTDLQKEFPRIEKCSMAGEIKTRRVIFDIRNLKGGGWPNGITADLEQRRLYWVDARSDSIHSTDYDGQDLKLIIKSHTVLGHPFSITVFEHYVFWTDWDNNTVVREERLYWTDTHNHVITSAFLNGTDIATVIDSGLTLDLDSNRLYWVSQSDNMVYWCEAEGQCHPQAYSGLPSSEPPVAMTLYQTSVDPRDKVFLFYTKNRRVIKLSHGNETTLMTDNTTGLQDMKVYNPESRMNKSNGCLENKGGCEQLCLPSGGETVCACTVGYQTKDGRKCTGVDLFLLYAQASKIHGVTLTGKTHVLAPISQISRATSIDYHAEQGRIYWVDADRREISCIKRDLSDRKTVVSQSISGAESLAVDWIGGNIYWTDQDHNTIEVSKLDGSQRYVLLYQDIWRPRSIALNPVEGFLYFANGGSNAKIIRARLDGSERTDFVVNTADHPVSSPHGLAVDGQTGDLYWCDKTHNIIERVSPTGRREAVLDEGLVDCVGVFIHRDNIYWADATENEGSIQYMSKTVKDALPQVLMKKIPGLKDIAVFDTSRQIGSNPCHFNNGGCAELCLYQGQGRTACACSHGKLLEDGKTCGDYSAFLLYSEVASLTSVRLDVNDDPNSPRLAIQSPERMKKVIGLAFDYDTRTIYFSDMQQGNIQSVNFNGSDFRVLVPDSANAEGLAFDRVHGHLYYTSFSTSSINRVVFSDQGTNSDPKSEIVIKLGSLDHPRHIVLDPCVRRIFWTNWSGYNPSIQTATYERPGLNMSSAAGTRPIPVTQAESIITEKIRTPNGLAIDHRTQKLYWSDAKLDKIERCEFDGSNRVVILSQFPEHPFGMVIYGNFLYWTDWTFRAVLRVNKWDGSDLKWIRKNIARQPMSIVAIADDADDCTLNPCHNNLFGCAEICMIGSNGAAVCRCGDGKRLLSDGKRCVYNSVMSCRGDDFVCENKRMCIPFSRTCDGFSNCADASDESHLYCTTRKCPPGMFQCSGLDNVQRCLPESSVCNGQVECPDNADERDCPCSEGQFRCNNGECIDMIRRCDYVSDCLDHSDEMRCNTTCDGVKVDRQHTVLVPCNTTSICIYPDWICDGNNDCFDNNDEINCDHKKDNNTCPHGYFKCDKTRCIRQIEKCNNVSDCEDGTDELGCVCEVGHFRCNGTCLPDTWRCDGDLDCLDGSDEGGMCENHTCTEQQFRCDSGRCISKAFVCDGDDDCEFGEDERSNNITNCPPVSCWPGEFTCLNHMCVDEHYVCDGEDDCGDMSDEPLTC
ncbi:low-density lipoprotein receptor-related protein, partial [Elysia marginata]